SVELQSKLLRVIDSGEYCRVGGDTRMRVDVRIIATTRHDIERELEAGRFRDDLFFRLAFGRVDLPPLRQRHGDVEILAEHFARRAGVALPPDFLLRHEDYGWPGNVRELENVITALGEADPHAMEKAPGREGAPQHAFHWALEQNLPFTSARALVTSE